MQDLVPLLILVGFALLMYLLLVRPQSRRQRELAAMQDALEVGDEVMLTSGVHGTLRALDDDLTVQVEIAPGVVIKVARGAIGQVVVADAGPAGRDPHDPHDPHSDTEVSEEN